MNIDRRLTNGLAWAGVLIVIGVPAADLLSAQFAGSSATSEPALITEADPEAPIPAPIGQRPVAPVAEPVEVAAVAPARPAAPPPAVPAGQSATAVDSFLQSGRPLPSYITGAQAPAAAPSQPVAAAPVRPVIVTTPAPVDPVEVASLPPQKVAPVPMPLSMRPRPTVVATVPPIIIPPTLAPTAPATAFPTEVTADDLESWETGPLSDFLARRQAGNGYVESDADGFFLDQQPRQQERIIAREADEPFFFFD